MPKLAIFVSLQEKKYNILTSCIISKTNVTFSYDQKSAVPCLNLLQYPVFVSQYLTSFSD
jgi:hypothetical protein